MNPDANNPYGISAACRILGVSRAAYYKWIHRKPTAHQLENEAILTYVIELEEQNHYIFGVKRLVTYINAKTPYHVSHGRVRRIMRQGHIQASIRVAKHDRKAEKKEFLLANKLYTADAGHAFHLIAPNMVWVTDCSELTFGKDNKQKLRLSAVKDLYDHSVIAWFVAPTETAQLVTDTMKLAVKNNGGIKPKILHSDQGSSYTAGSYNTYLSGEGIVHSMSRPGTPGDNSPMESLWSHLKVERFAFEQALSEVEMMKNIEEAINWYNNERLQETLNGMTPIEYRNHAVKEIA
ncbi:IS3 family transposase [Lacticaseibacillus suibinensis]|uniref:IS3 family transposase n=1 Tax=Lacticaseibacillus suibinensis TaxID=2486011 RepID=UPI001EF206D7|nr:IS3 family transposase [Lacticaseibacillus suibinensis]